MQFLQAHILRISGLGSVDDRLELLFKERFPAELVNKGHSFGGRDALRKRFLLANVKSSISVL